MNRPERRCDLSGVNLTPWKQMRVGANQHIVANDDGREMECQAFRLVRSERMRVQRRTIPSTTRLPMCTKGRSMMTTRGDQ